MNNGFSKRLIIHGVTHSQILVHKGGGGVERQMKDFGAALQADLTRVNFQLWHRLPITVTHTINLVWLGTP